MKKSDIIKELIKLKSRADVIIDGFEGLESEKPAIRRMAKQTITFAMFKLMDELGKVEIETYNYLKRRGDK